MEHQQKKNCLNKKVPIIYIQNVFSKMNILRDRSENVSPPYK